MVVVKSVVVVTTLIAGTGRAVVVTVMTVGIVTTTAAATAGALLGTKPDREVVTVEPDTGAIVVTVSVTVVEEHITTEGDLSVLESEGVTALRLS